MQWRTFHRHCIGISMSLLSAKRRAAYLLAALPLMLCSASAAAVSSGSPPRLTSSSVLVADANTGEVLLQRGGTGAVPIASITKLMTAIVIVDARLDLDEVITITRADVDLQRFSSSRLPVGAQITRRQALQLALMSSENRAAHALARTFPGGTDVFIRIMNNIGREIGMTSSRFADATGLSAANTSTPTDLDTLLRAAYSRPIVRDASIARSYSLRLPRQRQRLEYLNSNRLVHAGVPVATQKTGFINESGRTLVARIVGTHRTLHVVLLGSPGSAERAVDAMRIKRWADHV